MKSKSFVYSLIVGLFAVLAFLPIVKAEFEITEWPYYKTIVYPSQIDQVGVEAALDSNFLTQVLEDFRDVRIIDSEDQETPYEVVGDPQMDALKTAKIDTLEINGEEVSEYDYQLKNMTDGNRKSYAEFEKSTYTVAATYKMDDPIVVNKINVFTYDVFNTWEYIQVEASNDKEDWKVLRSKIDVEHATWRWLGFPSYSTPYEYYRITFWTKGALKIHEISLLTKNEAKVFFKADPSKKYTIYYGNSRAATPEYPNIDSETIIDATLLGQKKSSLWNRDQDKDGVDYSIDNCPFIENYNQVDSDSDGAGDVCDVANVVSEEVVEEEEIIEEEEVVEEENDIREIGSTEEMNESDDGEIAGEEVSEETVNIRTELSDELVVTNKNRMNQFVLYTIAFFIIGIIAGVWIGGGKSSKKKKKK